MVDDETRPSLPARPAFTRRAPDATTAMATLDDSPTATEPPTKLQLREKLKGFINELLEITDPVKLRDLNITIQRHLVALQIHMAVDGGDDFDAQDLQKQMAQLDRMLSGGGYDSTHPESSTTDADAVAEAAEILRRRGIDDITAGRLAGALGALMSRVSEGGFAKPPGEVPDGPR